ncbi:MAG: hypothetical protein A2Y23_15480 [Clostridiales bacterium GWB2_37_7]|nr:MAG: hypothetical protein A2Y23_15480 [Clostridiales bacterium GWB2_37_7]
MDSFWSKLLILGIVAAIGVFFIGNVYAPQRSAQEAMADSTQQSVNAVKMGVEDTAPMIVKGDAIISTVNQYCTSGNTVDIIVKKSSNTYTFTNSTSTSSNQSVTTIADISKHYVRTIEKAGTQIVSITFVEQ